MASIWFPQLLGNGKDVSELIFLGKVPFATRLALLLLKPLATFLCLGSGAPGGLFTPSLILGALLGGVLGHAWSWLWPGVPAGEFTLVGAAAVLAAATQGPLSAVVLMMELTGRPLVRRAAAARRRHRDAGVTHHRATLDLRRTPDRRRGPEKVGRSGSRVTDSQDTTSRRRAGGRKTS